MHLRQLGAFALGALFMLAVGGGSAYAATGGSFILGHTNSATATTSLTNGQGTALSLTSKTGTPALKVSNQTKVTNLNADKLDDLDSTKLALTAGRTGIVVGASNDNDGFVNTARMPERFDRDGRRWVRERDSAITSITPGPISGAAAP